jgi:hypothetical protein
VIGLLCERAQIAIEEIVFFVEGIEEVLAHAPVLERH